MRKKIPALLALVLVFALALTACGSDKAEETAAPETTVGPAPLGLSQWEMYATTWSSPNGATIHLTATPYGYEEGQTAVFVARLEGDDVASANCEWDGSQYTASVELNAEDGYCYYVLMTAADGSTAEVAVNTPAEPVDTTLVNMADALSSYCSLTVEDSNSADGKLTITAGTVQVQAPKIANAGEEITCTEAKLVLTCNGQEVAEEVLTLDEGNTVCSYEASLTDVTFDIPESLEDDLQMTLRLDVTLSNGQTLTAPGGTWFHNDGALLPAVG